LPFIAAGYGRDDGRLAKQDLASDGSGILRFVKKQVEEAGADPTHFTVSQRSGQGVCPGDSGGPALVKTATGWIQIGVASALSIPADEPAVGHEDFDYCAQGAVYMDLRRYRTWILEASAKLLLEEKLGHRASDIAGSLQQNPVASLRDDTKARPGP
jgi:secreted trypsin-like serine protease